jgi:hypothetical protein
MNSRPLVAVAALLALCGCESDEDDIPERNLDGTVVVRGELVDEHLGGDPRRLGVVYVGVYEGFDPEQLGYPYPKTGPRVGENPVGDALPYGGTSIGSYAFGCYRALSCNLVTGRYATLAEILEVHPLTVDDAPIDDEVLYDQCAWYYGWNSIDEFTFIGADQLDFHQNADGDWEAPFRAWHGRTPAGAIVYAFVDNDYTSCSPDSGTVNRQRPYDGVFFYEGTNYRDILNFPDKYLNDGDFLSSAPPVVVEGKQDGYTVVIDMVKDD